MATHVSLGLDGTHPGISGDSFKQQYDTLVDELQPNPATRSLLDLLANSLSACLDRITTLEAEQGVQEVNLARTDQYSRRSTVVVTGMGFDKDTESVESLTKAVTTELSKSGVTVKPADISVCHRNAQAYKEIKLKDKTVKVPPSVTVKFHNTAKKDKVLREYSNYDSVNKKPKKVKLAQSLNPYFITLKTTINNYCRNSRIELNWIHYRSPTAGICVKTRAGKNYSKIFSFQDFVNLVKNKK